MIRFIKLTLCLLLLAAGGSLAQQKQATIAGTVKDAATGETLIGATVSVKQLPATGTVTNEYGFYSLSLPPGAYTLIYSLVGFSEKALEILLVSDQKLDIALSDQATTLNEVVITANKNDKVSSTQMGAEKLNITEISTVPVLFGERDPLKVLQLLPGIKSSGDGGSGFYVRGGATDQNLILLDEAPVYNASHLLGFFSTFNADAIKDMTVYKGGMPAQYGGRLSSVLDIKMNEGNNRDYEVSGGIGLISAKLNVEGPIQKDKSSFLLSARRTYADVFLRASSEYRDYRLYFYDLNAKLNFSLGEKDRLYVSGYFGKDDMGMGETFGLQWGNATATVRWNHIFNRKLFSNTSLIFSNYDYNVAIQNGGNQFDIFSQIRDYNLKQEFQWFPNNKNTVRFGVNAIHHTITPGEVTPTGSSSINASELQKRFAWENALFASNSWQVSSRLNLTYGLRINAFSAVGEGDFYTVTSAGMVIDTLHYDKGQVAKTYLNLEPRLSASYQLGELASVKASYVRNVQNLHLISNSTASNPTDKWIASNNNIKPEISDQVSLGYYRNLVENQYELSTEIYYKTMQNQIDYRNGANIFSNFDAIETQLLFGKGRAYGSEWQLKKKSGKLTGWISYTLSKTERKIDGINSNLWYNARQDRTHDVALVGIYQLNNKWTLSANWVYYTGNAITFPAGKYQVDGQTAYYYTKRNGYRMPDYHRLDLGATMKLSDRKNLKQELAFSLYNAYGRENTYMIEFRDSESIPGRTEAVQTALFKFIPSISYNFKF
ncbi:hypothetical protein J2Y45_006712 [Dyadobacter sp. BE34]|uniref:TonB-dependent receptor plug n=1 Tax=Dyadobacter fermentans TaxID=94254 RepID=A0ABU1R9Q0_9BACT|nr:MULTISPECIES: TonB-dependent receptor [Dyadobacter]MDR6809634.1 hypothetical protein [Dyadobacter fermentans]MDR7047312.1 hypothetical protein [Dyadobacter sp. BE242]MDR7201548.1 hypothetical protein [Dyadobacter sp. BE34]MDR7219418.1 hypothetical protein [Dyadobacter sp. BE31]MDR7267188.1 hypothetical protein [Dyadobacter sp. BE32]